MDLSVFRSKEILSYLIFFSAFVSNAQKEQIHFGLSASYAIPLGEFRDRVAFAYYDNATAKDGWNVATQLGYERNKFLYSFGYSFSSFVSDFSNARENSRLMSNTDFQLMQQDSLTFKLKSKKWYIQNLLLSFGYHFNTKRFSFIPQIGLGINIVSTPSFDIEFGKTYDPPNLTGPNTNAAIFEPKITKSHPSLIYTQPCISAKFEIGYSILPQLLVSTRFLYNQTFNANYYYRKDVKEGYRGLLSTFNIGLGFLYFFQLPQKTEKL